METFILVLMLTANGPTVRLQVPSCDAGRQWLYRAWDWCDRSGLPRTVPFYTCTKVTT